jgi:hypothetical protein
MPVAVTAEAAERFYRAALVGLGVLERGAETRRRLGPEADARWKGFAGHLLASDRIDILCRDAAVSWGAAFSAAQAFQLFGLAADEPFGPDWPGVSRVVAERLWEEAEGAGQGELDALLPRLRSALGLGSDAAPKSPELAPATRVAVSGGAAIEALALAFARDERLSWSDQVLVVASSPAERQLAGLAAVLLDARGPTRLLAPEAARATGESPAEAARAAGISTIDQVFISEDADAGCRDFARAAADFAH